MQKVGLRLITSVRKKSKKNVVNPASIINIYGADTARLFMLSDSPPERDLDWSESGVDGCWKYLKKIWSHFHDLDFPKENFSVFKNAKDYYEFIDTCQVAADRFSNSFTYTLIGEEDLDV